MVASSLAWSQSTVAPKSLSSSNVTIPSPLNRFLMDFNGCPPRVIAPVVASSPRSLPKTWLMPLTDAYSSPGWEANVIPSRGLEGSGEAEACTPVRTVEAITPKASMSGLNEELRKPLS
jgi:hypothetical protein